MQIHRAAQCLGAILTLAIGSLAAHSGVSQDRGDTSQEAKSKVTLKAEADLELQIETNSESATVYGRLDEKLPSSRVEGPAAERTTSVAVPSSPPVVPPPTGQTQAANPAVTGTTIPGELVKKRALLVGINRYEHPEIQSLHGAVNDVNNMKKLLTTRFDFREPDLLVLTNEQATRDEILRPSTST